MHEFSISDEIARTVLDTAEKNNGKKVLSIQLEIGELTLLNMEQVKFWIQELLKGTMAEGAKVKVKRIKAEIECESCGYKGGQPSELQNPLHHVTFAPCPRCGSFKMNIRKGRECLLRRIQAVR